MVTLIDPGPLHLFWTTGVYHFWSLKDKSKVIFILPNTYKDSISFTTKIATHKSIIHIEYIDLQHMSIYSNYKYSSRIDKILSMFSVDSYLMHNQVYPENQYILSKINPKDIFQKVKFMQIGRMTFHWSSDFQIRQIARAEIFLYLFPVSSLKFKLKLVTILSTVKYFFMNKLFPFILVRKVFSPAINTYNGSISNKNFFNARTMVYFDNEALEYKKIGYPHIEKIPHPLVENYEEVFEFLYGKLNVEKSILILPTYGFHAFLLKNGWNENELIKHISYKWIDAVKSLNERFPDHVVRFKLHPSRDLMWENLQKKLSQELSSVEFLDPEDSAEYWIVKSTIIVGDVSSALWWAAMVPDRIVISLDIFDYANGDEMKSYENILYINKTEDITSKILFSIDCAS